MRYAPRYQNAFMRMLFSIFVQTPLTLWFKVLSYPLPQNALDPKYLPDWYAARNNLQSNNFTLSAYANVQTPPDKRAATVMPDGVTVIAVPDERIANLAKLNPLWNSHYNPSGTILQLVGNTYTTVHAFTLCGRHARVYAAASEIPAVLQYEFENIILARLGYDVSNR